MIPHILIECKRQEVSEAEYQQAIEQAYSYAYAMAGELKYVWVTSEVVTSLKKMEKLQIQLVYWKPKVLASVNGISNIHQLKKQMA